MKKSEQQSQKRSESKREFVRFVVADVDGNPSELDPAAVDQCELLQRPDKVYQRLRQFVLNELGMAQAPPHSPKHIQYMRRHELLDYCELSDKGHFKWYPKGVLIRKLLFDYAAQLAREWGAFEMVNPILIRGDNNLIGQLMGEFHERDYRVDGGRGIGYLRYASDPLAFPFMQGVRFSHKQAPLKVYEEANCFRNEMDGAVSGLKRVRNFSMTDMHAACSSVKQAREQFELLCLKFAGLMNDIIASRRWVLGWAGTVEFFESNRDWLLDLGRKMGVPAFFRLMPEMSHYYAIKNEFQAICEDGSNIQVSTVQWDVKDGPRFDIGFVNENGQKEPCPVIVHASSFGSIERALCAILENIAINAVSGKPPMFPLWLAPSQLRLIPVSVKHIEHAAELCRQASSSQVRAEIDDREESVGKRIREAEKDWVPYVAVIGDREADSEVLPVRCRQDSAVREMNMRDLAAEIRNQVGGMPYRPLPLPERLSQRPAFVG